METYSTYEAKAKFNEIVRKVRSGERVIVTYRGQEVAEIRPLEPTPASVEDRLRRLEERGVFLPARAGKAELRPLAKRPGALKRFLESRD